VFQADDFPAGWRETRSKRSRFTVDECSVVKKAGGTHKQETARDSVRVFERRDGVYKSQTSVYRSEDSARPVRRAVREPGVARH
jgi:hypothetical protein